MNTSANEDQHELWNGSAGSAWVDAHETLDRMFEPFESRLTEAVAAAGAMHALDVGCGTGATTIAAARAMAQGGRCTGVDLSRPMVEVARRRAARQDVAADFVIADAQTHDFAPASFDMVVSRFGVMFFADPVSAFANLHRATQRQAPLRCLAFRSAAENPFMTAAERAAAPLLPGIPPRKPGAPGQFAFADARRVQMVLESAGWRDVEIEPIDVVCAMPASALDHYLMRLGPVGLALGHADEALRGQVVGAVREAFAPYLLGDVVKFTAACWELAARA